MRLDQLKQGCVESDLKLQNIIFAVFLSMQNVTHKTSNIYVCQLNLDSNWFVGQKFFSGEHCTRLWLIVKELSW